MLWASLFQMVINTIKSLAMTVKSARIKYDNYKMCHLNNLIESVIVSCLHWLILVLFFVLFVQWSIFLRNFFNVDGFY